MAHATIELRDLVLMTDIGTYGPGDVVPEAHVLDMDLGINAARALVPEDGMAHVFDYDPLVAKIIGLAADGHYETQEWLMTRIARACATYPEVQTLSLSLRKHPVTHKSGVLGVRLSLDADDLDALRTP